MDTQNTPNSEYSPNVPISPDGLTGSNIENLSAQVKSPELAARPSEVVGGTTTPKIVSQQFTADDVARAIASSPMPTAPVSAPPQLAADQDVVEPEWVNAAEIVIAQTAGNPFAEEEAVEALQADYLKKRYGHEVKKSEGK